MPVACGEEEPLMPLKDADWSRKIRDVPYQDLIPDPQQQQKAASLPKLGGKQRSATIR